MARFVDWLVKVLIKFNAKKEIPSPSQHQAPLWEPGVVEGQEEYRFDVYHPKERVIFTYWNGEKEVHVDPMIIYKKIAERGAEIDIDWKVSRSSSNQALKAHTSLVKKVREIFDLKSFDQGGLTEPETVDLLDYFLVFCETLKKNSRTGSISQTETSPPTPPSSADAQPTSNISDSGSTKEDPSTDEPPSSPTASE